VEKIEIFQKPQETVRLKEIAVKCGDKEVSLIKAIEASDTAYKRIIEKSRLAYNEKIKLLTSENNNLKEKTGDLEAEVEKLKEQLKLWHC